MFDRILTAVVSIGLAVMAWLYARHRQVETLDNVPIPVQVKLPERDAEQFDLEITGPSQVVASFHGPLSRLRELRDQLGRGDLTARVSLTVAPAWRGVSRVHDTVRVSTSDLHIPPGLRATLMEGQNRVPVTLRKIVERRLPVRLDHALHDRLMNCQIEPATVLVRGPQDVLDRVQAIPTRPYTLPAKSPDSALREVTVGGAVQLVSELEGRHVQPDVVAVGVKLTLRPPRRTYEVQVPVHFLCPANFGLRPQWMRQDARSGRVTLKLQGPPLAEVPSIRAYVDLTRPAFHAERDPNQVVYSEEPIRLELPADFQLAQEPPTAETFLLVPFAPEPGKLPYLGGIAAP